MKNNLFPAIKLTLLFSLFFMGIYTLAMFGIAKVAAPNHGDGETVSINGKVVGYEKVGQLFTNDNYFNSRPSAVNYNAAGSGGSNKGPSNPEYLAQVQQRIDTFLVRNPTVKKEEIPSDLVTASGSGQDPDISPEAAFVQVARIARVRNISEEKITALINGNVQKPLLGLFGTSRVNVLKLNIELDNLK
jgi:K+-transporting ATPase ATPase C chain